MAYITPADLRERTRKPWAVGLVLTEGDASDADLTTQIALVTSRIEEDLGDDFEPPSPDNDEIRSVSGWGTERLYIPWRVRSLTTVETLKLDTGVYTVETTADYRLHSSLNSTGTAMVDSADWLDIVTPISTGLYYWPWGAGTVRLTGKFGWAVVPDDIKRLTALMVYDAVKATGDPLTRLTQKTTVDAVITYGESREMTEIIDRYARDELVAG